jgi:hypothetical protein
MPSPQNHACLVAWSSRISEYVSHTVSICILASIHSRTSTNNPTADSRGGITSQPPQKFFMEFFSIDNIAWPLPCHKLMFPSERHSPTSSRGHTSQLTLVRWIAGCRHEESVGGGIINSIASSQVTSITCALLLCDGTPTEKALKSVRRLHCALVGKVDKSTQAFYNHSTILAKHAMQ